MLFIAISGGKRAEECIDDMGRAPRKIAISFLLCRRIAVV